MLFASAATRIMPHAVARLIFAVDIAKIQFF